MNPDNSTRTVATGWGSVNSVLEKSGGTWQWLSLPYVYTESRQKQPGEAHEEDSL